ncbi:MAG: hypothetical protein EZS26_001415 [Candidatus Ordinivivax streblomastigis]|uniref:Uncharacterized protein n=1 Tax=Candidatus Ordinivivax streblomastigis TaxID=2540710 RepID=A0A5M8P1P9_9BACT|nr:MAG: hypothetical protein EZS26_001415 [Candidatus Ordinivivax streblomastigis]
MKKIISILIVSLLVAAPSFAATFGNKLKETTDSWLQKSAENSDHSLRGARVLDDEMTSDPDIPIQDAAWVLILLSGIYCVLIAKRQRN